MSEVTEILHALGGGQPEAADRLLAIVYDELHRLAVYKLSHEPGGQTLQPTALVHEVYLRLLGDDTDPQWEGRGHFFAAAAEAMRRILIENARRKKRLKHGGTYRRVKLEEEQLVVLPTDDELLALDEALDRLVQEDGDSAAVVKLHFFAGLTLEEVAAALGVSHATVKRRWAYARAWLRCALQDEGPSGEAGDGGGA
jgi:RNA polymerase sigma factor (TIGR02999 family)